ncbi:MAG: spore germination protein GerW family protein [Candidatus Marinimicrobia bacterium]|nr:spore germination protein GerW family protein [Candidatus Neomarinimicrobiota bacterium]
MNQTLEKLLDKAHEFLNTKTVVGDPIYVEDVTLIPISKISVGFGSGDHNNKKSSSNDSSISEGFGGGMIINPIAVIAVHEGHAKLMMLSEKDHEVSKILDLVPDLLDRFAPKKTNTSEEK